MRRILLLGLIIVMLSPVAPVLAQASENEPVPGVEQAETEEDRDFRDTTGYRFPALSRTVRDMQNLAFAMQLRDYCADDRIPDAFVRSQLARFSVLTGRDESCRSLNDY